MNRAEYELGRAGFRLMCGLQRAIPLNPNRLQVLKRHPLIRRYAALMLPIDIRTDPLSVPLSARLLDFTFGRDGIPF